MPHTRFRGSLRRLLTPLVAAIGSSLLFVLHLRWVLTHFSSDGYLYDSGWLAYLFESRDPLIHNPSSINGLSFYAHHLSPHIYLFGAPLARLALNGFQILAVHQGLFFALFFFAAWRLASAAPHTLRTFAIVMTAAMLLGAVANPLFQAAGYPHYEIAVLALSSFALSAWIRHERRLFILALAWLPLVREDGGLYAGYICVVCAVVAYKDGSPQRALRLIAGGTIFVGIAAASLVLKAKLFPGFDAFAFNFSGHHWDHVTNAFMVDRLRWTVTNPNIVPVLVGCALLSTRSLTYATGFALLVPLYVLYMLSVRPEHGHFTLYFALPWLLPPITWLAVYVTRARSRSASITEAIVILSVAIGLAAPVHALFGANGNSWYVAKWAFKRPVVDIPAMKQFSLWVLQSYRSDGRTCASMGIAALVPNHLRAEDVVDDGSRIAGCHRLLLLNGDMSYARLRSAAERDGVQMVASRYTAELWVRRPK